MRVLVVIFILVSLNIAAQSSCDSAKVISIDSLQNIPSSQNFSFFKIRRDSSVKSINFFGGFESIEINPIECISEGYLKLDSNGLIRPTEEMINSGVCYCNSCLIRYSSVVIGDNTFVKILKPNSIIIVRNKVQSKVELAWYEKKLKPGDKIRLDKILFVGGEARFRLISFGDLERLFKVLKNNSDVTVEIQGHVNGPGKRNTKKNQDLSEARAQAVVDYLIKKGIDSKRLSSVGFGNTQMVYPKAKSEYEMQFNRRVEILVK